MISVVSPVYMAEDIVDELIARLKKVLLPLDKYEIILIDDCSTDYSWKKLKDRDDIIALRNEKNIGQHATIRRGVELAKGDWIVVMDCDLQDNPNDIPLLYEKIQQGFDSVVARRYNIRQSWCRRRCSELFHKLYQWKTGVKTDPTVANFAIYRKGCYGERKGNIGSVDVEHCERYSGKSSYTLIKLIKLTLKLLR